MECNKDEAIRAKDIAVQKFESKDLEGAKRLALKAQALYPTLEGIAQMITIFNIYLASSVDIDGEKDWYSILSVPMSVDDENLTKQYRKLVLEVHPDKNKSVGAEGAFKMVHEAWTFLSDKHKRALYDQKRSMKVLEQQISQLTCTTTASPGGTSGLSSSTASVAHANEVVRKRKARSDKSAVSQCHTPLAPPHFSAPPPAPPSMKGQTFWTSCKKCRMHYEYFREFLNLNLRCARCRQQFIAKETLLSDIVGTGNITGLSTAAANMDGKAKSERKDEHTTTRKEDASHRKYTSLKRHSDMITNANIGSGNPASGKKMKTTGKDAPAASSSSVHNSQPIVISLKRMFSVEDTRRLVLEKAKSAVMNKLRGA